jgi:hypothetical protein
VQPYILFSFDCAPPAIFCVRSCTSSCFCSSNCFFRSSLFLPQSCAALTLLDDCHKSTQCQHIHSVSLHDGIVFAPYHLDRLCRCLSGSREGRVVVVVVSSNLWRERLLRTRVRILRSLGIAGAREEPGFVLALRRMCALEPWRISFRGLCAEVMCSGR